MSLLCVLCLLCSYVVILEEVGEGDLAGVGLAVGDDSGGAGEEVYLLDGGRFTQGEVVGHPDLDVLHDDGTKTEVPAEGGALVDPATLHGMTSGRTSALGEGTFLAPYVDAPLGTGEDEGIDHVLVVDTIAEMEGELEGAAIDGAGVLDIL